MLTTILPGIRDLRTPLATGYLYLTLLWMWFGSSIPEQTRASGLLARIYDISEFLGVTSILTALTFVAYIVGSVLSLKQIYRIFTFRIRFFAGRESDDPEFQSLQAKARNLVLNLREDRVPARKAYDALIRGGVPYFTFDDDVDALPHEAIIGTNIEPDFVRAITARMGRESNLIATRLHATSKDLFDDYDRASSEAEFRASIALPVSLIVGSVPFVFDLLPILNIVLVTVGIALFIALGLRSLQKEREARNVVVQVLAIGDVKSPTEDLVQSLIERQKELQKEEAERRRTQPSSTIITTTERAMMVDGPGEIVSRDEA